MSWKLLGAQRGPQADCRRTGRSRGLVGASVGRRQQSTRHLVKAGTELSHLTQYQVHVELREVGIRHRGDPFPAIAPKAYSPLQRVEALLFFLRSLCQARQWMPKPTNVINARIGSHRYISSRPCQTNIHETITIGVIKADARCPKNITVGSAQSDG